MKRVLIFTVFFPLVALVVFLLPGTLGKPLSLNLMLETLDIAYVAALVPALLCALVDWALAEMVIRLVGTTLVGVVIAESMGYFLWGGVAGLTSLLMAGLVGGLPAAFCSLVTTFLKRPLPPRTKM